MDLERSPSVTLLVTWCQFILIASRGLNMSSRSIITCSIYLSYGVTLWGYRKGSRANSNCKSIGITCIKCYLLQKICLQCNIGFFRLFHGPQFHCVEWTHLSDYCTPFCGLDRQYCKYLCYSCSVIPNWFCLWLLMYTWVFHDQIGKHLPSCTRTQLVS